MKIKKILLATGFLSSAAATWGASLSWDTNTTDGATITGGAGTWDTTNTNWNTGSGNTAWVNANKDLAIFSGTAGTVTLGSNITASGITFSSGYTIAGGGNTLTLDNGASAAVITKNASGTISANLASSGAVTITGGSNLSLTGTNTGLTGSVSIGGANTVTLGNANALGTAGVTITAGNQPAMAFGGAFTLNNAVTLGSGSSLWTNGSNLLTFGGNVTLGGNAGITLWLQNARVNGTLGLGTNTFSVVQSGTSAQTLTLAGPITGTGGITMNAANKTLILANTAAANTYSGGTTITSGIVSLGTGGTAANTSHVGALGTGAVSIATGGTLRLWIKNDAAFTIANNLTINGGTLRNEDGNHTMSGTIAVGTNGATFQSVWSGKNLSINNTISGSGPVTVQANGSQIRFFGNNTYTGATTLSNGSLLLSGASASSGFSIANGTTLALRSITLGATQNITGAGTVTKDISTFGSSVINGNNNTYTGATNVNIDRFTLGSTGVINGTSSITVQAQWSARFENLGSTTTPGAVNVNGFAGSGTASEAGIFYNGNLAGTTPGSLTAASITLGSSFRNDAGSLAKGGEFLNYANSTVNLGSGAITVNGQGNALAGGMVSAGSQFTNAGTVTAGSVTLNSSSTANVASNKGGTYTQSAGSTTVTTITLAANGGTGAAGTAGNDAALNLTGGTINTTTLAVDSGTVTATGGTLNVGSGGITSAGGRPIAINLGATTLAASASWSSSLGMNLNDSATGTTIQTGGGNISLSGTLSGSGKLSKTGSGVLSLSGSQTYSGDTTVAAGVLAVNGSLANSNVTVTGGTLRGSGSIASSVAVASGATLAPGNSIESLAIGSLDLQNGSIFDFELQDTTSTGADVVIVGGPLSLGGANLALTKLGSGTWALNDKLTLIAYEGTALVSGFSGYANHSIFSFDGADWKITYNDTTGGSNYVSETAGSTHFVTLTVVPEPGTAFLALGSCVFLLRRRRQMV